MSEALKTTRTKGLTAQQFSQRSVLKLRSGRRSVTRTIQEGFSLSTKSGVVRNTRTYSLAWGDIQNQMTLHS